MRSSFSRRIASIGTAALLILALTTTAFAKLGEVPLAIPDAAQLQALKALPGVDVTYDPQTGVPVSMIRYGGYLTAASQGAPYDIAFGFLLQHAALFKLGASDLSNLAADYSYMTRHNGVTHLSFKQLDQDRWVYDSVLQFSIDRDGRILIMGGQYFPSVAADALPVLNAQQAVGRFAEAAGGNPRAALVELPDQDPSKLTFENTIAKGLADPRDITAELVTFPLAKVAGQLGWRIIALVDGDEWYEMVVDASTGEILHKENYFDDAGPEGNVFTAQSPTSATQSITSFAGAAFNSAGWVTDDTTVGNNVDAHQDLDGDNASDFRPITPASGDPAYQHFNYTWGNTYQTSGGTDVVTDQAATVTELFYWNNFIHDYLYALGFDEPARNFQTDNFGRGGAGGDAVWAEANDNFNGGSRNNANFGTPADGGVPLMQMYAFNTSCFVCNVFADGTMDADLIIHEYGHGVSNRLVGSGNLGGGIQTDAMGEGWGDFIAVSIFNDPDWAEYATGRTGGGRSVQYDTSPHVYSDLCSIGFSSGSCEVHDDGEIWATALWDLRTRMISRVGAGGKGIVEQLVIDGMKNTATNPSFLTARDGILAADVANNGGAYQCLIWGAFAAREMGFSASTPSGNSSSVTSAIDGPASCAPTAGAGGPYNTVEGTSVNLSGAASTDANGDPLTYEWDLDNDGSFDDGSGVSISFNNVGQDGSFTVRLRVTDIDGFTSTDTTTVNVTNVAPTVNVLSDAPKAEGAVVTFSGSVTEPGSDVLTVTIDWGDGSALTSPSGSPAASPINIDEGHTYYDNGTYSAQVCASDDDVTVCTPLSIGITNVAPTVALNASQVTNLLEGQLLSVAATFTDPGSNDTYTYSIQWGDGTTENGVPALTTNGPPGGDAGTVSSSRVFGDNGTYPVVITVTDDDGGSDFVAFNLVVDNVDPTAIIDPTGSETIGGVVTFIGHSGAPISFTSSVTDPGSDDERVTWDAGDGIPSPDRLWDYLRNPPLADQPNSPTNQPVALNDPFTHTFGDACLYTLSLGSTDDDLGVGSDEAMVIMQGNGLRVRGAGYWKSQYALTGAQTFSNSTLDCYLQITGFVSNVYHEARDASTLFAAHDVLFSKPGDTPVNKLDREILTAWLNFANGALEYDQLVDTNGDLLPDTEFAVAMTNAETVRLNPLSTSVQLDAQRKILQSVNRE